MVCWDAQKLMTIHHFDETALTFCEWRIILFRDRAPQPPPFPVILRTLSSNTLLSRPSFLWPLGPPVRALAMALRNLSRSAALSWR